MGVNEGVTRVEGVAAVIPRSFSNLAKPKVTENVQVELRRDRCAGVPGVVLARLLLTVLIRLPRTLQMDERIELKFDEIGRAPGRPTFDGGQKSTMADGRWRSE